MTFQEAIAEVQRISPDAPLGVTVQRGQYYQRAVNLDYHRLDGRRIFSAIGPNGKEMWVYISDRNGRICCGDKG